MSELTYGIDSGHLNFPKDNLWRQLQEYLETELNNASDIPKPLIADTGAGDHDKAARFREQISYAKEKGVIVTDNLTGLNRCKIGYNYKYCHTIPFFVFYLYHHLQE